MMIKIAACLLALGFLAACESTTKTTKRETLREQNARYASNENASSTLNEPASPAEGPEDVGATGTLDPTQNPALVPSPLLRNSAIGSP
jgi:hypothetical protein